MLIFSNGWQLPCNFILEVFIVIKSQFLHLWTLKINESWVVNVAPQPSTRNLDQFQSVLSKYDTIPIFFLLSVRTNEKPSKNFFSKSSLAICVTEPQHISLISPITAKGPSRVYEHKFSIFLTVLYVWAVDKRHINEQS